MRVRALLPADIPILEAMAQKSGYPYPNLSTDPVESVRVVVDDDDRPLMACAAKRLVELYLWCGEFERPLAAMFALRLLHESMAYDLAQKGYNQAEAFIPPGLAKRFSRRLEKSFGWVKNWPSWNKTF